MNPVAVPLYLTDGGGCLGRRVRIAAQVAELDVNLVRTRVRQGVEDGRGLEEHGAGLVGLALAQQHVAEPGQRVALAEQGTDLAVGVDGLPVVGLGLGQVTQVQVDEAQAVQGVGRAAAVARFPVQAQRPLAVLSASSYWPRWAYSQPTPFSSVAWVHQCPAALTIRSASSATASASG
jgi:hypothetical protein